MMRKTNGSDVLAQAGRPQAGRPQAGRPQAGRPQAGRPQAGRQAPPSFDGVRLLVVGDVMVNRYWQGAASRLAPDAPVPVVHVHHDEASPGGAANVAMNAAVLGAEVTLLGVAGDDVEADVLTAQLEQAGVRVDLVRVAGSPTVRKLWVTGRGQHVVRVDFEDGFPGLEAASVLTRLREHLASNQAVVFSDYGKGTVRQPAALIEATRLSGCPVLVDPKGSDFSCYRGATLLSPNRVEFEAAAGPCSGDAELERRGLDLLRDLRLQALVVTRDAEGMTLLRDEAPAVHVPACAHWVEDVAGAGDTVIATLALAVAAGVDYPAAVHWANTAAGVVVEKPRVATVSAAELARVDCRSPQVVSEAELLRLVSAARARGEKIVMTNGCFDILHAGHVQYLEQVRRQGDRLIVAVNDDDSVRRFKGASRPVNPLAQRLRVLAGLQAVDWVVPFSEDSPDRLVCQVKPDVMAKGGDYHPDQVPGSRCVREAGGEIFIAEFVEGHSTSRLIERLQEP